MPFGGVVFENVFRLGENAHPRTKTWTFLTQKESTHTPGLLSRVERRNEREREGDEVYKQ
jgi:hypothetical protein